MTTQDILSRLAKGATLCMEHTLVGKHYWLEPGRYTISTDQAERIIPLLKPGGDRLFEDFASQTWKAEK